jgi:hypothetical protein
MPHLVEWNVPPSWKQSLLTPISPSVYETRLGTYCRRNFHQLRNISGISGVVRNGKTVGLLTHLGGFDQNGFKSFAASLNRIFLDDSLIFMFLPLQRDEDIWAVGLRRLKGFRFPADCPVIEASFFT